MVSRVCEYPRQLDYLILCELGIMHILHAVSARLLAYRVLC